MTPIIEEIRKMIPKVQERLKILHIASSHVDIMCLRCRTAFDVRENETIACPFCSRTEL